MVSFRRPAVVRPIRPAPPTLRVLLAGAALAALSAAPAVAQSLRVQVGEGLVTVRARGASVSAILAEWARVGGVNLVNGETVPEGPVVTLQMDAVPEGRLLDALLGDVAGYIATLRPAHSRTGASIYDRVLILGTSTVAARAAPSRELESVAEAPTANDATEERSRIVDPAGEAPLTQKEREADPAEPTESPTGEGAGDQPRRELARPRANDGTGGPAQGEGRPAPVAPPRADRKAPAPVPPRH